MVLDFNFTLSLLKSGKSLVGLYRKPLYQYRRHAENATAQMTQNLVRFEEEFTLAQAFALDQSAYSIIYKNLIFCAVKALFQLKIKTALTFLRCLRNLAQRAQSGAG